MTTPARVLIVDDHALVREGLKALLQTSAHVEIVAEATDGRDAIRCADEMPLDLVLMDLSLPGMSGIEAISVITTRYPKIKIIVITGHRNEEYIHACLQAGATGYIVKESKSEELMGALDVVLQGHTHLCRIATERMIGWLTTGARTGQPTSPWNTLTPRERQVLQLVAEGCTNKAMARFLSISPKTVEKHRANLMAKLDVHSTAGLTAYAVSKGLLEASLPKTHL